MTHKSPKVQIQFINQALSQAQNDLSQIKTLMRELEESLAGVLPSSRDLPGIIGKFDGTYLVTDDGKKIQVPENYAGKSKLVFGDTLKMIEGAAGETATFKQIERVARTILTGILVKKDGKLVAVTSDGSHSLIPAAVSFHHGEEGDEVRVIVPEENRSCSFAALDEIPARDVAAGNRKQMTENSMVGAQRAVPETKSENKSVVGAIHESPAIEKKKSVVKKEQTSSLTFEPEPARPEPAPAPKPAPKPVVKKAPEPLPIIKPKTPPTAPVAPPAPAGAPINSILSDDDLR